MNAKDCVVFYEFVFWKKIPFCGNFLPNNMHINDLKSIIYDCGLIFDIPVYDY
jgi:hypothetical protein